MYDLRDHVQRLRAEENERLRRNRLKADRPKRKKKIRGYEEDRAHNRAVGLFLSEMFAKSLA